MHDLVAISGIAGLVSKLVSPEQTSVENSVRIPCQASGLLLGGTLLITMSVRGLFLYRTGALRIHLYRITFTSCLEVDSVLKNSRDAPLLTQIEHQDTDFGGIWPHLSRLSARWRLFQQLGHSWKFAT